jgi:hypothetical protein
MRTEQDSESLQIVEILDEKKNIFEDLMKRYYILDRELDAILEKIARKKKKC